MPVIARLLWILVVVLAVLAIYTSLVQNEETAGGDNGPSTSSSYARNTPVADDPPVPVSGDDDSTYAAAGQTPAPSGDLSDVLIALDNIIPMSIDQAYKSIPHKRTTYSASGARISRTEGEYLERMFALTDQMTAARVAALTQLYYGRGGMSVDDYNRAYEQAMQGFSMLSPPNPAVEAHRQIVKAIQEQHAFLNAWDSAPAAQKAQIKNSYGRNTQVQSSHKRLLSAYGILMRAYGHDSSNNKTSFYDHLCALDFI